MKSLPVILLFLVGFAMVGTCDVSAADDQSSPSDLLKASAFDFGREPVRYLENRRLRLGVDLSLGGAVTFLEDKAARSRNMINSHDWGRQIQQSYYSGPNPFIGPNGEKPVAAWAGLGWNPIQSGSYGRIRSKTITFEQPDRATLRVRCIPMQWPHLNVPGDCVFEATYRLEEENVVSMTARILNARADKTFYPARTQEMPALYTNGPWYKLVTYQGTAPFTGGPTSVLVDKKDGKGWPWSQFYAPEQWAALVNDQGWGVGLYQPDTARITGGFAGGDAGKGRGGPHDGQTGYISPIAERILDANIDWSYHTYIMVGTVAEMRRFVYAKHGPAVPLAWRFDHDRMGWVYQGSATDTGWPIRNGLDITFKKAPRGAMRSDTRYWQARSAPVVELDAAFAASAQPGPQQAELVVHPVGPYDLTDHLSWTPPKRAEETAQKRQTHPPAPPLVYRFAVQTDGKRRIYRIPLADNPAYDGAMKQLILRFPEADGTVRIWQIVTK